MLQGDADGTIVNYTSFEEAGEKAQELLDKLNQAGRSEVFDSWEAVCQAVGSDAKVTRLACIVKIKENGETKYRLVVDSRRSGVNGLMTVRERGFCLKLQTLCQPSNICCALTGIARPMRSRCLLLTFGMPFIRSLFDKTSAAMSSAKIYMPLSCE